MSFHPSLGMRNPGLSNALGKFEIEFRAKSELINGSLSISLRIISCAKATSTNPFDIMKDFVEAYPAAYTDICSGKSITCTETGKVYDALPTPAVVIADVSLLPLVSWYHCLPASTVLFCSAICIYASNHRKINPNIQLRYRTCRIKHTHVWARVAWRSRRPFRQNGCHGRTSGTYDRNTG